LTPSTITTLTQNASPSSFHNWVRMAPDNTGVVVAEVSSGQGFGNLVEFNPGGIPTTLATTIPGGLQGFELDGDDQWILVASTTWLFSVDHSYGSLRTLGTYGSPTFNEIAILRENGIDYAIANFTTSTAAYPKILGATRQGIVTTIVGHAGNPLLELSGIEVDPLTGDLITTDFAGPMSRSPEPNGVEINRVSQGGVVTTLVSYGTNGCRVGQDNTLWIAGFVQATPANVPSVIHYDLAQNATIRIMQLPGLGNIWPLSAVELYGSHPLTCKGTGGPGKTIDIAINSKRLSAGGASYQVALSLARRPGLKLQNGEHLHLDLTAGLFFLTAQNLAPSLFQGFAGQLSVFGTGAAKVVLPASFPSGLGITVFAAAVIYDRSGVVQVTNTHWFEI